MLLLLHRISVSIPLSSLWKVEIATRWWSLGERFNLKWNMIFNKRKFSSATNFIAEVMVLYLAFKVKNLRWSKEIMELKEAHEKCKNPYEKEKQSPEIWISFVISLTAILLRLLPLWKVSHYGINKTTERTTIENKDISTLAQKLGGIATVTGLYYTWR